MWWSVALPTDWLDATSIAGIATALELSGVDACHLTDHPYPPRTWLDTGGHRAPDPLVALAFAAAATTRLRLHTNVLVAGYRNPLLAAHGVATLDALSGGRVILGLGAGYLAGEFAALGVDHARRGALLDEAVAAMTAAWQGETLWPKPVSRPHPPLWFGGNSAATIRRVVASGQGWSPFPASKSMARHTGTAELAGLGDLRRSIGRLRAAAEAAGRTEPIDVCCVPFSHPHDSATLNLDRLVDEAGELAELGVTWMAVRLPAPSQSGLLENIERFGTEVVGA
ncbi:MAG TPA: TIGR03619 family F420-dependent LLM class oxidoreductase [Pseudonocardiaceae bacterium]|jgi:probable F420-dependent oxidoreductase